MGNYGTTPIRFAPLNAYYPTPHDYKHKQYTQPLQGTFKTLQNNKFED